MKKALVILLTFVLLASALTACECKHEITEVPAKTATCTEDGATAGTYCTKCGEYIINPEVIPAKGHTVVDIPAKDVTCTENGHTGGTECSVCHTVLSGSEIKAKGHQYAVTAETATCEKDGAKVFTCSVCGDSYEEAVKAFGHKNKTSVNKEATCSATGVRTTVCERCGKTATETIDKKAHTFISATCEKPKTCTLCGETVGSALGHSYSGGKCTRCGKAVEVKITLPSVPQTIKYYSSQTCKVTAVKAKLGTVYSWDTTYDYDIEFTVTSTYHSKGNNYSDDQKIGYKLYDSDNVVVKSGTIYTENIQVGEITKETITLYDLDPAKTYKLVLLDVG